LVLPCTSWYFPVLLGTSLYFLVLLFPKQNKSLLLLRNVKSSIPKNRTFVFCYYE
jgi:hypothetical protein